MGRVMHRGGYQAVGTGRYRRGGYTSLARPAVPAPSLAGLLYLYSGLAWLYWVLAGPGWSWLVCTGSWLVLARYCWPARLGIAGLGTVGQSKETREASGIGTELKPVETVRSQPSGI